MGTFSAVIEMANKDPSFDSTFESKCKVEETTPATADSTFPSTVTTDERFELHVIQNATGYNKAQLESEFKDEPDVAEHTKLIDCPDVTGGQYKGRIILSSNKTQYELRRVIGITHKETVLPRTQMLAKEQATF